MTTSRAPSTGCIAHTLGKFLFIHGPMSIEDIARRMPLIQRGNLRKALISDTYPEWFAIDGELFAAGALAVAKFRDTCAIAELGQITPSRSIDLLRQPPLRKEYMLSTSGRRNDIPEFSVRENFRAVVIA